MGRHVKLGVCYYPEHWPEEMWADDAARMKALGLATVRIGEFAWAKIEPEPGQYDWDWLDRAIETLAAAGLEIILGTPTATPPKWLIDAHPDILCCDDKGQPRRFGSRRHYSFSSQTYQRESQRIIAAMAARYAAHPAITLWQTDNEYGCHDTVESNDRDARAAFRIWLKDRYGEIDQLNAAWGTIFWSQTYRSFEEIDPPLATVTEAHPAHRFAWRRFCSDQVARYNDLQVDTIRAVDPGAAITHNYMGEFTQFDHRGVAAPLTLATWDSYPLGFLQMGRWDADVKQRHLRTGHPDFAGFHHDLYRRIGKGRFGVMEQQPGPVNWAPYNPVPLPGMVTLWTLEAYAHGAELVSYFRWRQAPFAQEQMHAGLNRPDNVPAPAWAEAEAAQTILDEIGADPETEQADVALMFDYEADWMFAIQPQGRRFQYLPLCYAFYGALRRRGLNVDIVFPGDDLTGYKLIALPSQPILTEDLVEQLDASGATILIGPRSGSRDEDFAIPETLAPGPLQAKLPIQMVHVESLPPGARETAGAFETLYWRETIESEQPCHRAETFGEGTVWRQGRFTYLSAWPGQGLIDALIDDCASAAGLTTLPVLPDAIRMRRRGDVVFVFNYGEARFDAATSVGLSDAQPVNAASTGPIEPGGVATFRLRSP